MSAGTTGTARTSGGGQDRTGRRGIRAARRVRSSGRFLALAVTAATVLVVGAATAASAHTELESVTPADAATVDDAPAEVGLVFSASLLGVTSVTVTGPDGATVSTDPPAHDGPRVFQALGPLTLNGAYTTNYVVVAGDGDEMTGTATFTYTGAPTTGPTVATAVAAATTAAATPGATESPAADKDDESRDVSSVVIGAGLMLLLLVALFFAFRRLRRRS